MIESLLPDNIKTLRTLFQTVYADRPVILLALEKLLDDLTDELWDGQGTVTRNVTRLDAQLLPELLAVADLPRDGASATEAKVALLWDKWRALADTLEHP